MEECGATVSDGQHELYIYKCEDPIRSVYVLFVFQNTIFVSKLMYFIFRLVNASYLNLPSSAKDANFNKQSSSDLHSFSRSNKEVVIIKSLLCSTKLTQNSKFGYFYNFNFSFP